MPVIATYNVHSCVGGDGQFNPSRVADVIGELRADVVALQEVDAAQRATGFVDQWKFLAEAGNYRCIPGISLRTGRKRFGNALLTRCPIHAVRLHDLSIARREPRSAIDADLVVQGHLLRVIALHLGLRWHERRQQSERLLDIVMSHPGAGPERPAGTVLLGDLNEWRPIRNSLAPLFRYFHPAPAPSTFPTRYPVVALDRILICGALQLRELKTHVSRLARLASDHLPVSARASWMPSTPAAMPAKAVT